MTSLSQMLLNYYLATKAAAFHTVIKAEEQKWWGGFRQTIIRSAFDKVSKCVSLYEYVYVGAVHKSFQ